MPACAKCGKYRVNLQQHIKQHGMTGAQYKADYPGAKIVDVEVGEKQARTYRETCQARYGTTSIMQVPEFRERARESLKQSNTERLKGQRIETFTRNGREVRRKLNEHTCQQCHKVFYSAEYQRKFCSLACVADAKQELRESTVDHHFFDAIRTEEQAYCLGFIIGDGHIVDERVERYRIQITQNNGDRDVLESIRQAMRLESPVRPAPGRPGQSLLVFHSKRMWLRFHQWGLTGNKTTTAQVPPVVKPELVRHLIRGMFDADGWITLTKKSPAIGYCKGSRHLAE